MRDRRRASHRRPLDRHRTGRRPTFRLSRTRSSSSPADSAPCNSQTNHRCGHSKTAALHRTERLGQARQRVSRRTTTERLAAARFRRSEDFCSVGIADQIAAVLLLAEARASERVIEAFQSAGLDESEKRSARRRCPTSAQARQRSQQPQRSASNPLRTAARDVPGPWLWRPMKVKASGIIFRGSDRSGGRSRGAQIASCGLGSVGGEGIDAVFARICVVVTVAGACRRDGERLGCRVGAGD